MPLDTRQQKWLPLGLNPQACVQDTATASSRPGIPFPDHRFRYLQPPFQALLSSYDQQSCGKQVSCLNGRSSCDAAASPEGALKSSRKRFIVFDQSGNQTRLLQCGFPLQLPPSMDAEQGRILDSLNQEKGFSKSNAIPDKLLLRDDHVNGKEEEESEMHEDTEEINALLYSDDEDNDDCESDDEVMSTGHSAFQVEQQACNKTTREELDETESNDDGPRRKRQKLMDHSYIDPSPSPSPSLVDTITKLKGLSDEKLHGLSEQQETGSGLSEEQSRKDKIHTALKILESVVPGAKGKEALLLLDEAIDYLKLLKRNLNSSKGLNYNHW